MQIYNLLYYFQFGCFLLSFLFSIRTVGNTNVPSYMKWFFVYSFTAFMGFSAITILNALAPERNGIAIIITIISILFHYVLLSFFFSKILVNRGGWLLFLFILICSIPLISFAILKNISDLRGRESFSVVNFCLLIFCIIYYYQLFTSIPKGSLLNDPSFWIVSGIFFSMGITIPFYSAASYLKITLSEEVFHMLNSVGSFAYGVMHLFFTKAYICSLIPKKL